MPESAADRLIALRRAGPMKWPERTGLHTNDAVADALIALVRVNEPFLSQWHPSLPEFGNEWVSPCCGFRAPELAGVGQSAPTPLSNAR